MSWILAKGSRLRSTDEGARRLVAAAGAVAVSVAVLGSTALVLPTYAASTPQCTSADLHASYAGADGAAGTIYGRIVLTNISDHACRTGGYGGLSYVGDRNGTQIGAPARRIDSQDVATYVVKPDQRLRSVIGETEAGNYGKKRCRPTHVDGFRVYVPNSFTSQFIAHPTTGCRNHAVKLITQKPYRLP